MEKLALGRADMSRLKAVTILILVTSVTLRVRGGGKQGGDYLCVGQDIERITRTPRMVCINNDLTVPLQVVAPGQMIAKADISEEERKGPKGDPTQSDAAAMDLFIKRGEAYLQQFLNDVPNVIKYIDESRCYWDGGYNSKVVNGGQMAALATTTKNGAPTISCSSGVVCAHPDLGEFGIGTIQAQLTGFDGQQLKKLNPRAQAELLERACETTPVKPMLIAAINNLANDLKINASKFTCGFNDKTYEWNGMLKPGSKNYIPRRRDLLYTDPNIHPVDTK